MKIRIALQATKNKVPCEQTKVVIKDEVLLT